jgi:DNA-binding MarR family transcriptional regulator
MSRTVPRALKQKAASTPAETEVLLRLRIAAAGIVGPWSAFLKGTAQLTPNQYTVLSILRGSHPESLSCSEIAERMIDRDPDVTRLVDRLETRGLVERTRRVGDRRVVDVRISAQGLAVVRDLDPHVSRMPAALLGHLGQERLAQLRELLDAVIGGLGTFP